MSEMFYLSVLLTSIMRIVIVGLYDFHDAEIAKPVIKT